MVVLVAHSHGGRRGHAVRSRLRPVTLPGPLAVCPSPSSSHHQSLMPSLTPSIAVCALPRLLPSASRCCPSVSAAVSFRSAVSRPSAVSASAVIPRPFPLTYQLAVVPLTSLAHVAIALIFCPNLAHHVSVLIRLSRRVAPRPSATVIIALLFVLALSALACASPSASLSSWCFCACPLAASRHALITSLLHPLCSSLSCFHVSALRPVSTRSCSRCWPQSKF